MMLTGRVPLRRGIMTVLGCFVLFGASSIAAGIQDAARGVGGETEVPAAAVAESPPVVLPAAPAPNYDPYAGASVPRR